MSYRQATFIGAIAATLAGALLGAAASAQPASTSLDARLDALEAQVVAAEDVSALKRLQREYGYYVDKGMWEDVADLYTDDAVANYPAGTYIGHESIRKHLYHERRRQPGRRERPAGQPHLQPHEHPARRALGAGRPDGEGPLARVRDVRRLRRRRHVGRGRVRDDVREAERRLEDQEPRLSLGLRRAVHDRLGASRAAGRGRSRRSARPAQFTASGGPGAQRAVRRVSRPRARRRCTTRISARRTPATFGPRSSRPRKPASAPTRSGAPRISRAARRISRTSSPSRISRRSTAITSIAACGTRSRTCSPTTARSRWACAACTSAKRACGSS